MGPFSFRKRRIVANAQPMMEPDERAERIAMVNRAASRRGQNVAVIATDRHVYLFEVKLWGFTELDRLAAKIPIGEARLERGLRKLQVGEVEYYPLLGAGRDTTKLVEYVEQRKAAL